MGKELKVKDIVRKIGEVAGLIDVYVFDNDIVRSYLNWQGLDRKTEFAVLGILVKYQDELLANKKQYEKNPEMKKDALLKVKTIEGFILEYRELKNEKYRICPSYLSGKTEYQDFKHDAEIVCEKFEKIYDKEIKEYKSEKEKKAEQAEKEVTERRTLLKENLKNL